MKKLFNKIKALLQKELPTLQTFRKVQVKYEDGDVAYRGIITALTSDENGNIYIKIEVPSKEGGYEQVVSTKEIKSICFYESCNKIWLNRSRANNGY